MFGDKRADQCNSGYNQRGPVGDLAKSSHQLPSATDACYDHDWMETLQIVKAGKSERACH